MHVLGLESNDVTLKMTFHGSWKETHEQPGCRRVKGAVVFVLLVVAVVLQVAIVLTVLMVVFEPALFLIFSTLWMCIFCGP